MALNCVSRPILDFVISPTWKMRRLTNGPRNATAEVDRMDEHGRFDVSGYG
jgi:hypothetical protein